MVRPSIIEVGKTYGGLKVVQVYTNETMILVECQRCGRQVKRNRSNVRSRRLKSCGGFSCNPSRHKSKEKTYVQD